MFRHPFSIFLLLSISALAAFGGWHLGRQSAPATAPSATSRKVLFYQSPMHPWIKSDQPGNCTICGMKLVPVFEGDASADAPGGTVIRLSGQSATVTNIESGVVTRQPLRRLMMRSARRFRAFRFSGVREAEPPTRQPTASLCAASEPAGPAERWF